MTDHGEAAWIIPARDSAALHEALLRLADDRDLNAQMGEKALAIGRRSNSWQNYGDAILNRLKQELAALTDPPETEFLHGSPSIRKQTSKSKI